MTTLKRRIAATVRNSGYVFIDRLIKTLRLDPRAIFYRNHGILKHEAHCSGEAWFISTVLPFLLADIDAPVLLDVGANIGDYSLAIAKAFPAGRCYALEPNPIAFQQLREAVKPIPTVVPINVGAASQPKESTILVYASNRETSHGSMYKQVLIDCHHQQESTISSMFCRFDTIDHLLAAGIVPEQCIHFIKVDTEGSELDSLRGATDTISRGVRVIQFEFNEMNVVSRCFLKDFYELLGNQWRFYRLDTRRLIYLGSYDSSNEIFKFQNIIAIRDLGGGDPHAARTSRLTEFGWVGG